MDKYLVLWPKSVGVKRINYHYTQFGEIVDYLDKFFPNQILGLDNDIQSIDVIEYIKKNNIAKVLIQVNYENAINAFSICEKIKKQCNIPILGYGSIALRFPDMFLNSGFDVIHAQGDPEVCMRSFIKYYNTGENISELQKIIDGGFIISNGKKILTNKGKYIHPDNWGVSRKEQIPVKEYDDIKKKERYVLNISRGCPFGCPHCLIQLTEGRKERRRSIENLKEAIEYIKNDYSHIKIWAANFTLDKKYVDSFCDMMISDFPEVTWECATRIDLVKEEDMLIKMHKSGCKQISLGIESLNNSELIGTKDFKKLEIQQAILRIQNSGIQVKGCVMLGMPNQQKDSIINTLRFLKSNRVIIRPTIYTPYQELNENISLENLSQYNRKTLLNTNVSGVSPQQLLQLVENPYNYEQILDLNRDSKESEQLK
ncbi:MAG: radical SAM protein [Clostridia bacterium]|nr:radical SAM protein [Clostridia bacterium]